jgi:endoglucanase Acf2
MPVSKLSTLLRLVLAASLTAGASSAKPADVKAGAGHYTTHLRAGGEREPPAAIGRAAGSLRPVQTNQWYSSLLFEAWPHPLYAQPGSYRPTAEGFFIDQPRKEPSLAAQRQENDIIAIHRSSLAVLPDFELKSVHAGKTSDWAVDVVTGNSTDSMTVTIAHGSPYSFHRLTRGDVTLRSDKPLEVFDRSSDGRAIGVIAAGKPFGVFAPAGSRWETPSDGRVRLVLPQDKRFFTVAVLPGRQPGVLADFHRHAYAFISDTRADYVYDEKRSEVTTTFSVKTEVKEGNESGTLFGLYPHQWYRNPLVTATLPYQFDTIRGPLKLVAGTQFQTRLRYTGIMPFWPGLSDPTQRSKLKAFLDTDTQFGPDSLLGNRGTYWEGKGFNRAAQVMSIAEQQGDTARRNAILAEMKKRLELWFKPEPEAERYFHYNQAIGTLIGYPDEFGTAQETNDHHFHYGYWIYGAAQIALRDPEWASRSKWGGMVEMLISDIATTERDNPMFPRLRAFDPYEGHSWAAGLAHSYDGNNQESSSEAINAWAALILWAEATGNKSLRDTGIYLYTHEVEAANHYWFDLHGLVFPKEYANTTAGIVWSDKFVHNTWWTEDPREIHGINFMPITAASLYLGRDPAYIRRNLAAMDEEFKRFIARGGSAPKDMWQDVLLSFMAMGDAKAALAQWNPEGAVEDGETRTHTFFWLQSLARFGRPNLDVTADTPLYAVFARDDGTRTYLAYNASKAPKKVTFSDGTELRVAPLTLGMRSVTSVVKGR